MKLNFKSLRLMYRTSQFGGKAILAASILAGGASLLNVGGAMAAVGPIPNPYNCPPGATEGGATICSLSGPSGGTGSVEFNFLGINLNGRPTWSVNADFSPNLAGPYSEEFVYSLKAPNNDKWLSAGLDQFIIPGFPGASVRKQIYGDAALTELLYDSGTIMDSNSTPLTDFSAPDTDGLIFVKDTYSGLAGADLDNFINTVQTPGPLPVLGAGAAFGFSRKLRGRIKASRTA